MISNLLFMFVQFKISFRKIHLRLQIGIAVEKTCVAAQARDSFSKMKEHSLILNFISKTKPSSKSVDGRLHMYKMPDPYAKRIDN